MIFKTLKLKNIMSIGEAEIQFDDSGIVSVLGINNDTETASSNGAGKTSIFDGMLWTIYGQILRSLDLLATKPSIDWSGRMDKDVGNIYTNGKPEGELEFYNDKHTFKVVRTLDSTRLWMDDEPFEDKSKAETEQRILDLFPPIGLFCTMVYIGDRSPFRFSKWSAKERTEALEYLIDLSDYEDAYQRVKKELKDLQDALQEKSNQFISVNNSIDIENGKLDTVKESLDSCKLKLQQFEEESKAKEDEIDELRIKYNDLVCVGDKDALESELDALEGELVVLLDEKSGHKDSINELEKSIAVIESNIKRLERENDKFDKLGKKCPTCEQEISDEFSKKIQVDKDTEINGYKKQLEDITPKKEEIQQSINEVDESCKELNAKISEIKGKLKLLDESKVVESKIKSLEEIISNGKDSIAEDADSLIKRLDNISESIDSLEKDRDKISKEIDDLKEEIEYYEFWEVGFSSKGLRSYKLDTVLKWLNDRLNNIYAPKLFGSDMSIFLNPEKELKSGDRRNAISLDVDYSGRSYSKLSSGEYNRVDFLIHLALRDMAENFSKERFNILVIDEVFGTVDTTALVYVKDLLRDFSKNVQIWLSSHIDQMQSIGDAKCVVTKEDNISSIELVK